MPVALLLIAPLLSVVLVDDATVNVSVCPTSARAWKLLCATVIEIEPFAVVVAAVKFDSFPFRMYMTFGAALLWFVCVAGFAASAAPGIASARIKTASVFLPMSNSLLCPTDLVGARARGQVFLARRA